MRTFIAIKIPVHQALESFVKELKLYMASEKIKWVNLEGLHLTLLFLGNTPIHHVDEIKVALTQHLKGFERFNVTLKGVGTFGAKANPKIFWVGVEYSEQLNKIHKLITDTVVPFGYEADDRGFNPHITLGRIKGTSNPSNMYNLVQKNSEKIFQKCIIGNLVHYRSDSTPMGPIYTPLYKLDLA